MTPIGVITCGGGTSYVSRKKCFRLSNNNTWEPFPSMNKLHYKSNMVVLGDILVAIDFFPLLIEKINWENGDKWEIMDRLTFNVINHSIHHHYSCVTKWNEENFIITGGD